MGIFFCITQIILDNSKWEEVTSLVRANIQARHALRSLVNTKIPSLEWIQLEEGETHYNNKVPVKHCHLRIESKPERNQTLFELYYLEFHVQRPSWRSYGKILRWSSFWMFTLQQMPVSQSKERKLTREID